MRKKLDTRFPAARIKKIMQADEEVGKIALAVPVLMSKALELFLQDLCERTYDITVQTGARTVSSLHLKHCVQRYSSFDFLKDVVSKVPDYTNAGASGEVQTIPRRRKTAGDELSDIDEHSKKNKLQETSHASSGGRVRGRGRGRGRGRVSRVAEPDHCQHDIEPDSSMLNLEATQANNKKVTDLETDSNSAVGKFDLNTEIKEDENIPAMPIRDSITTHAAIREENHDLSLSEMDRIEFNPLQLGHMNSAFDDEDYDEEG